MSGVGDQTKPAIDSIPAVQARREPAQDRSRQGVVAILTATASLLAEVGVDQLTMTAIARDAGVSKAAVYRYFPTKAAVLRALAIDSMQAEQAHIQALAEADGEVREILTAALRGYLTARRGDSVWTQLHAAVRADPELSRLDLEDTHANAVTIAEILVSKGTPADPDLPQRVRLILELCDSVIRLLSLVSDAEAETLITDFCALAPRHTLPDASRVLA